jgi:PAS domain S-box-containing protein
VSRRIVFSREFRQLLELTDDEPLDVEELLDLYRPEWRTAVRTLVRACASNGTPYQHEGELETRSGRRMWVRGVGEAERDETGSIVRLRGAIADITAEKTAEMRLREHASLLDNMSDAVVVRDPDGTITYWNRGAEQMYGWAAEEVIGRPIREVLTGLETVTEEERLAHLVRAGTWMHRNILYRRDGTPITVDLRLTAVLDERGALRSVLSIATDVTERVDTRERLEYALDAGGIGAWEIDVDSTVTWRSRQHDRIFGYQEPLAHWDAGTFIHHVVPDDRQRVWDDFGSAVVSGRLSVECRIRRVDGAIRSIALEGGGVVEPDGQLRRLRGTIVDITDRVELEERLAQSQRLEAIGQLTGGIAHDFNNLLTVIVGSAELLHLELAGQPRLEHLAAMIQSAAERGADLTQRLLAFGRRQTLRPSVVDASATIRSIDELLRRAIRENIELVTRFTREACPIFIDPGQFEAALLNLCINASDAMPDGGRLVIETAVVEHGEQELVMAPELHPGTYVRVTVTDDGVGMSPEVAERAFEPFFSTKDVGKGSGLGLSMVYGFLRQSDGHVRIDSMPGAGTTVIMCLPIAARPGSDEEPLDTAIGPPLLGRGEAILVVEDDALLRGLAVRLLGELGYVVHEAADGPDAVAILRSGAAVDLLFTDVVMPGGMTGAQLAERARRERPDLPVLFTSGYTELTLPSSGEQTAELLHKPYRRVELAARVRAVLDGQG